MPVLTLIPKKAVLLVEAGDGASFARNLGKTTKELAFWPTFTESLIYSVASEKNLLKSVRLTSGEKFSKLEGVVRLTRSLAENTDRPVGLLTYVPEFQSKDDLESQPSTYQVDSGLPARQFDELVSAARHNRIPTSICVDVAGEGVEYGWEPDGSGIDWNNKEHPSALIAELRFSLPFVMPADDEDREVIEYTADTAPASRTQLDQLIQRVDALRNDVRVLLTVVVVVGLIIVARFVW